MRHISVAATYLSLFLFLFCTVSVAWGLPSFSLRKRLPSSLVDPPHLRHDKRIKDFERIKEWLGNQQPLADGAVSKNAAMPPPSVDTGVLPHGGPGGDDPIVSDVLPKTRGINVFASLTRQFESVESLLNDSKTNITVLAPRNSAIQDLPRKPWENPDDYEEFGEVRAYEGDEGRERAKRNLKRFVSAHIIPQSPWKEGEEAETIGGDKLRWRKDGDKIYIEPSGVEVESIAEQVSNGEVWILNGVINYR
ncbi:hypothetical protein P175DRAFT_0430316 [Aspergillus ochraceoroseus IBT 24754]|uniref:FAS1 domain-containing protein n=2 Tax=Aspergillus ochraceoroseus TaxID=138278 RepID=A0A2T5M5X7_9EURO|nr:uncharacterized protein P175DRAFT_0430316 [Aspergillus ochraceoroseus IBT 24754]KKK13389.1 hypothetical protein AOCH_001626 [Aspergillus ochraceoroseus]PTU23934.1 hypothetical protein P175DRAFT_0430316 [Aspergillus ochraceoroseus IBT 24754]